MHVPVIKEGERHNIKIKSNQLQVDFSQDEGDSEFEQKASATANGSVSLDANRNHARRPWPSTP